MLDLRTYIAKTKKIDKVVYFNKAEGGTDVPLYE